VPCRVVTFRDVGVQSFLHFCQTLLIHRSCANVGINKEWVKLWPLLQGETTCQMLKGGVYLFIAILQSACR
jgi:hypothetical protein